MQDLPARSNAPAKTVIDTVIFALSRLRLAPERPLPPTRHPRRVRLGD